MKSIILVMAAVSAAGITVTRAGEIGRYNGGVLDIRDHFMPDPGIYGLPVSLGMDVHIYALSPALIRSTPCTFPGGSYGGSIAPTFANNSLEANLFITSTLGDSVNNTSFGLDDLCAQPLWLDWSLQHFDFSLAYGFYAPAGQYNTRTVPLPGGSGTVTVDSKNNFGSGYWTHQAQAGIAWYPMTNKATAVTAVGTYEYNGEETDFDIKPGQMITVNWCVSQYLPLWKNQKLLLELGPAGYDSYQITDSTGGNAFTDTPKSRVHAMGGQFGLTYVPWNAFLMFHGFYEYAAASRFQGPSIGLNFGIKF